MNLFKSFLSKAIISTCVAITGMAVLLQPASAQQIAYDDAGNYQINANWTNGANQGFGFMPWAITTNGTDFMGTYVTTGNVPPFVIDSITNVGGTNYTNIWGIFANGTNGINTTVAYRQFSNSLGTNTFKIQWGSRGAGSTVVNGVTLHGWCGFTLRNGNDTNGFANGVQLYVYFLDGNSPSTIYVWDGGPNTVTSVPGTSFSDLGRQNITNAIEAEITPAADGSHYHLILKDCVAGRTLFTFDSTLLQGGSVDSVAMFCQETTGDQDYNRIQITAPTNIPPSISNVLPTNGSIFVDATANTLSFEVDSFNSTVSSSAVTVTLNGLPQTMNYNTASPTTQLLATSSVGILSPDTFYTCVITAQDANGNIATSTGTFNTFLASDIYIDAYDYNYGSGQFVNNNTPTNAYAGLLGNNGIDYKIADVSGSNNTAGYRTGDLPEILTMATDATGEPVDHANLRANGYTAYNIGFTDVSNWENYSRVFPTANYSIYARAASGVGGQFEIERLTNATPNTTNQTAVALGRVTVPNTGGSRVFTGQLLAMTDLFGNTVVMPLSGNTTLRQTALASQVYNLEYLAVVAVSGAPNPLRPYIATATPIPNATGVGLSSKIVVNVANRTTSVTNILIILDGTNLTTGLTLVSNTVGSSLTYAPPSNLPANSTNTLSVVVTDSTGNKATNNWTFVTAPTGGVPGNGVWSAGGGLDMNWSTAANWTGGTPGPGFSATFQTPGSTTNLVTNNIVSTNVTVLQLNYSTNNNGYHTTWIQDGVTLTVSNPIVATATAAVQVGGVPNGDNVFNKPVTNTITGLNGTLLVTGQLQQSSNSLNFQVRQCATPAAPYQTTLDMSGLGTLIANVGKFYVAQGGNGASQSNVSGRVFLARTNTINLLRVNAGQFEVGDSSGGLNTLPGSSLYLGIANTIFVDTARIGKQKATNNLMAFNPAFLSFNPVATIHGTNGGNGRVTTFTVGDADTDTVVPINVDGTVDMSGGTVNATVSTMIVGEGCTSAADTGHALGVFTMTSGTVDVLDLKIANQRAANTAPVTGTVNVNGGTLLCSNIELAHFTTGATAASSGTLNIASGGTVRAMITPEGGASVVSVTSGTLIVSNTAGTAAAPIGLLTLSSGSLHFAVDGNNTATPGMFATAILTSGPTGIKIDSVANVTGPVTVHLIGYTGSDPFAGLTLAGMPADFTGTLVDNSGSVDLLINVSPVPPAPKIQSIVLSGGSQVVLGGTNNNGSGGTYEVLASTNVATPLSNWVVLTNGTFDSHGNFLFTNATTNTQRFFILRAP